MSDVWVLGGGDNSLLVGCYLAPGLNYIQEFLGTWTSVPLKWRAWRAEAEVFPVFRGHLRWGCVWRTQIMVLLSWKDASKCWLGVTTQTDPWDIQLTWRKQRKCKRVQRWTGQAGVGPSTGPKLRMCCRRSDHMTWKHLLWRQWV